MVIKIYVDNEVVHTSADLTDGVSDVKESAESQMAAIEKAYGRIYDPNSDVREIRIVRYSDSDNANFECC
jgi:hypothetical protein